ncbi:MAG: hypothetical protein V4850_27985 [Myxococcota bacterium]
MSLHARALSSFKLLAVLATFGAWSAPAMAQEECVVPGVADEEFCVEEVHAFARYVEGTTPQQKEALRVILGRAQGRIDAAGSTITATQLHGIVRDVVVDMRAHLGDTFTQEFLAHDVMGPIRSAPMYNNSQAWLDHAATLEISHVLLDQEDTSGNEQASSAGSVMKFGFAVVGAVAGAPLGPEGVAAGAAVGAVFGSYLADGLGMNEEPGEGEEGEGGEGEEGGGEGDSGN